MRRARILLDAGSARGVCDEPLSVAATRQLGARGARLVLAAVLALGSVSPVLAQGTEPVPGIWRVSGHVRATACAGPCASRRQTLDGFVTITNAGVAAAEGFVASCSDTVSAAEFDGVVTVVPAGHGWLRLRVVDRARFRALLRRCIGYRSLRLSRFSARARIAADGLSLDEKGALAGSVTVSGRAVTFFARARVHGEWIGAVASPTPAFLDAGG